jgi:hypothetical protein
LNDASLALVTTTGARLAYLSPMSFSLPSISALPFLVTLAAVPCAAEPVVLELFTSQGCAVSPKADKLAAEKAIKGEVLLLTFPVDYWDYLGWKDTLGSSAHTARQRAYALARSERKVYTPQIVVNGTRSIVGSDRAGLEQAIENAAARPPHSASIQVEEAEGQIDVEIGDHSPAADAEVWLFAISASKSVEVERGQNAHHTLSYHNVVRKMTRLGSWTGKAAHFSIARKDAVPADADHFVVVVQEGSGSLPGAILGFAAH